MESEAYKIVKYRRTSGGYYPCIEVGYALRKVGTTYHATNARGNVRFFSSLAGARRALRKLEDDK